MLLTLLLDVVVWQALPIVLTHHLLTTQRACDRLLLTHPAQSRSFLTYTCLWSWNFNNFHSCCTGLRTCSCCACTGLWTIICFSCCTGLRTCSCCACTGLWTIICFSCCTGLWSTQPTCAGCCCPCLLCWLGKTKLGLHYTFPPSLTLFCNQLITYSKC